LRQLNIHKNIFSRKFFSIYDPMQQGKGLLVLDEQTSAHIDVIPSLWSMAFTYWCSEGTADGSLLKLLGRCIKPFGMLG